MAGKLDGTAIVSGSITATQLAPGAGGGPKISSVDYPGNASAVLPTGGETVTLVGTGFDANVQVYLNTTVAPSVSFANANSVSFTTPALSVGQYILYAINGDGGSCLIPNFEVSGSPTWVTTSPLPNFAATGAVSVQLSATSDSNVSYSLDTGSSLPAGLSLSSSGLISGTLSSPPATNTTYNFTVVATDEEQQQSTRAFAITATLYDFTISPAVGGVSEWTFAINGNLSLTDPGEYTLTFGSNHTKTVKMWGSGGKASTGGVDGWGNGAGGGAATGNISFVSGSTYKFRVPAGGATGNAPALAYGAGNAGAGTYSCGSAGSGGGYAGIFLSSVTQANAVMMAGGGGGGATSRSDCRGGRAGMAGGGTTGQTNPDSFHGAPGTQSAGGSAGGGGTAGSALQGGNGGSGAGGGGGGYYGGGTGTNNGGDGGGGGGGGSGYYNPSIVSNATLYIGSGTTPGNNSDSDRGSAGTSGAVGSTPGNGKILIIA